jgi:hypothetical protein
MHEATQRNPESQEKEESRAMEQRDLHFAEAVFKIALRLTKKNIDPIDETEELLKREEH